MGPIGKLFSTSPDLKKTEANKKTAKNDEGKNQNTQDASQIKSGSKDQVQIPTLALASHDAANHPT